MMINGFEYTNPSGVPLTGPEIGFIQKCAAHMRLAWEPIAARPAKSVVLLDGRREYMRQNDLTGSAVPDHHRDTIVNFACEQYRKAFGPVNRLEIAAPPSELVGTAGIRAKAAGRLRVVGKGGVR